jgi:hypothetical protein
MPSPGERFPHVSLQRTDSTPFTYADIWQRRHLLLVTLAPEGRDVPEDEARFMKRLETYDEELRRYEVTTVVTRDTVAGLSAPSILIADRWGEVVAVESAERIASLPDLEHVLEWLRMVARACSW